MQLLTLSIQAIILSRWQGCFLSDFVSCITKSRPKQRAPKKCELSPTQSGKRPQKADSASGEFVHQVPPLPVKPAVGSLAYNYSPSHPFVLHSSIDHRPDSSPSLLRYISALLLKSAAAISSLPAWTWKASKHPLARAPLVR